MLKNNIIRKSKSPWAFPVVLAAKSDGTWRFCVDYSKLNKKIPLDSFPLPRVDDYLDRLQKGKIFTVVDLASGFWQIPVREEDKEKLAFTTPFGTYDWNVMPFGFLNAPPIFQRAISETLDTELYISCLVYIDDIIIFSDNFVDHLTDIDRVFKLLEEYNWKIKLSKCQFAKEQINYLGHTVTNGLITPLERKFGKGSKYEETN
jgi:Reverse transcriptase (RNA-dependent DNA polymerase).